MLMLVVLGGCRTFHPTAAERTVLAHSYLERAARLARSGQTERAMAAADMAVSFDSSYLPARLFRGALWLQEGSVEKALEEYEQAVRLAESSRVAPSDRAMALAGRAACYSLLGRAAESAADYEGALRLFPEQTDWRFEWGKALFGAKRFQEAEEAFSAVLDADPPRTDAVVWRGESRFAQGRYGEAARDYIEALRERPTDGGLWRRLGVALLEGGMASEAREALEKAAELEPKDPAVLTALGMACEAAGDDAAAFRSYRRAMELSPGYAPAQQGEKRVVDKAQKEASQ